MPDGSKEPEQRHEQATGWLLQGGGEADPFAAAVHASAMPIVVSDARQPDLPVVFANEAFCRLTGHTLDQIVGRNCRFLQGSDTCPDAVAHIRAAIAAGEPAMVDLKNYRRNGEPFWNRLALAPVRDPDGTLAYFVASQVDVSAEKEQVDSLEGRNAALSAALAAQAVERARELERLNGTLEAQVAARTSELRQAVEALHASAAEHERTEAALRQAQKMEAVGQLTGGIAHDFNNMLQGAMGGLDLAEVRLAQGRGADATRCLEAARRALDRAAGLTHRLLAFARRQALLPRRVEPDALVQGMEELIVRTMGPHVDVQLRLLDGVWPVLCDANQLENALLNLAINARDAMPGGGALRIETAHVVLGAAELAGEEGARPGEYVRLTVADTGTGMTPDVLAHAFEPFFTTKPVGQGTGLGLSQIYGFARQSGGSVRLDSAPGRGTRVHLFLPRHRDASAGSDAGAAAFAPPPARGGTVLLVEDEVAIRELTAEALREAGYAVIEAEDGPSGLRALADTAGPRPDLLLTDVGLPGGLNGRQLADAARAFRPELPVLMVTGYAGDAVAAQGGLPGGMAVLGKPFTLGALVTQVASMLAAAAAMDAAARPSLPPP